MKYLAMRSAALLALLSALPADAQCLPPELKKLPSLAAYGHGTACALEGDTLLVGLPLAASTGPATGEVWVYERDLGGPENWGRLVGLLATDGAISDLLGASVDLYGDVALTGAPLDDDQGLQSGSAYLFDRNAGGPGAWGQVQKLTGSGVAANDAFGRDVAIYDDRAVIGCPGGDGLNPDSGTAYVFRDTGASWFQQSILSGPAGATGDQFGISVDVFKDVAVVGAPGDDALGADSGMVHVFQRSGNVWVHVTRLAGADTAAGDRLGTSVALSGDTLIAGAPGDADEGPGSGAAYVFQLGAGGPGLWGEVAKLTASNAATLHGFGSSVQLDGDVAMAGALGVAPSGVAYLFHRDEGGADAWGELGWLFPSDTPTGARFGGSLALDGTTLAVGAPSDDSTYVYQGPIATSPVSYCKSGVSASGCQAALSTWGTPSATAVSGFSLVAQFLEGNKDGLFFYGTNGRQAKPWGNGSSYQCVVPPVKRGGLLTGTGTSGVCDGRFLQDLNARWCPSCSHPGHNPGPGTVTQAQLWYRDPFNTSNQTTSLSNAVEFTVCP